MERPEMEPINDEWVKDYLNLTLNVEATMRRTAQEAHTPLKQWLVMAENDIATSSLKRFCKYILVRKSEPVSQTRHSTVNGKITT
ncbi:hypothetical protein D4764_19G0006050 [Takifugu flavidus]|uniref:Uncharacterized protein n=1 Tax=Takifugu flavidus TaxID=433684 RepID=A0A5C6NT85_9TELE|nr:hypothetical protein D4764_19G0006050 [Takifugu flavidus]